MVRAGLRLIEAAKAIVSPRPILAFYLPSLLLALALSWGAIDLNWDLLNYHIAAAHMFLRGGYFEHVHPGGMVTYLNPLVNLPAYFAYWLLGFEGGRMALAAMHALMPALCFGVVAMSVEREQPGLLGQRWILLAAGAFVLGLIAPITMSVTGTSFQDIPMGIFVVAALWLALRPGFAPNLGRGVLVGAILAVSVALKMTNLVLAVPFGLVFYAFVVALASQKAKAIQEFVAFGVSAVVVTLAVMAPWGFTLAEAMGSPMFPLFNKYFQSPLAGQGEFRILTLVARDAVDFLTTPWRLAQGGIGITQEVAFRDARYAIFFYLALPLMAALSFRKGWTRGLALISAHAATAFLTVFTVATWAFWDWSFGIHRYIVVIDVLIGMLLVRYALFAAGRWTQIGLVAALALVHAGLVQRAFWWTAPQTADGSRALYAAPVALDKALVFLEAMPMGYVVTYLGAESRTVLVGDKLVKVIAQDAQSPFGPRVRALLAKDWPDGVWLASSPNNFESIDLTAFFAGYGLEIGAQCRPMSTWVEEVTLCPLTPASTSGQTLPAPAGRSVGEW